MMRYLVYVAILYAGFAHNAFWVPSGVYISREGFRTGYVGYDSDLVMNRIGLARDGIDPFHPLYWQDYHNKAGGFIYKSQVGPQGIVLAQVYQVLGGGDVEEFAGRAACGSALLTAAVFAAFYGSIARRIGNVSANVAVLLTACTPVLLPFATSLYWVCFLLFAPFVATWLLYPSCITSRVHFAALCVLIAGLVGLKCLCGYEYVSTIILSPIAAVVYHRTANGERLRSSLMPAAFLITAGVIGFAAAMGLHILQLNHITGGNALDVIRERAAGNTIGNSFDPAVAESCLAPNPKFLPDGIRVRVRCLLNYFWLPAAATPVTWGPLRFLATLGIVSLLAASIGWIAWRRRDERPAIAALVPAAAVGLFAAAAWHLLALTHTCIHMHLNLICYAVPFLPLAYVLLGWVVQRASTRVPVLAYAPHFLASVAIAGNIIAQNSAPTDDAARARVEAILRGEASLATPLPHMLGPVISMNESPRHLDSEAWFHIRLRPDFNGTGTPTCVLNGWAIAGPARDARPTLRVVAVAGGKVLDVPVRYARITLIERGNGGKSTSTFFALAVPEGAIPVGERLRLFAVSGPDFERVSELKVPQEVP